MIARQHFKRDIFEHDPSEPSTEEKIFLVAKRGCIGFALLALVLGLLDLGNIHSVDGAFAFWQSSRVKILALGDTVRGGVQSISIIPSPETVAVRIPARAPERVAANNVPATKIEPALKTEVAKSEAQSKIHRKTNSSVAELAAARTQDAVQLAMVAPPALTKRETSFPALTALRTEDVLKAVLVVPRMPAKREMSFPAMTAMPNSEAAADPMLPKPMPVRLTVEGLETPAVVTPAIAAPAIAETPARPELLNPLAMVPLPREAPGAPSPSPAERLNLAGKNYTRAERCLANAVYFEARSEPVRGQIAVAQVVMNRVFSGFYPNDVCSVVYQNASRHLACQFTFACDGKNKAINERGAWARANRIARQTLEGQIYLPEVAKSTHYHANYVHPNWVHEMKRLARFGIHSFYRPYAWGNGAEEPVWGSGVMAQASAKKTAVK